MLSFFERALPGVPAERRAFTSEVVLVAMAAAAEKVTAQGLDRRAVDAWAKASADMYCAYIESISRDARKPKSR